MRNTIRKTPTRAGGIIFDKDNTIQSILPFGSSIEQLKKELKIVGQ